MTKKVRQQLAESQSKPLQSARILMTKLYIPPARPNVIVRPHLIKKLLSSVDRPGSFTVVSGPAGFGKTTLLSGLANRCQQPIAWVSLDESDNNVHQFWTYLITACQSVLEDVGDSALEVLNASQYLPDDTIPILLLNDFATQDQAIVLILDDYHIIQNQAIHASLVFLLDHFPHNLHIIVSTRIDPPWPLVRYRARNQLLEVRAQDLRFSLEEAAEFLIHTMALELSVEDVAALAERTEGWIAGLQLAALSLQERSDVTDFIQAFTGSHIYIAEYLIEEILQKQSEAVQVFLLQTSLLKRLSAGLCEAVTDCPDGQAMLADLYRANSFIIPLDSEGHWFRYHHLFADLLQARLRQHLPADAITALHLRAANWYEQHDFVVEAVKHFLAAENFERVASLVEQVAHTIIFTGQVNMLREWLDALPEVVLNTQPRLAFYRVWIDLLQGKAALSDRAIQEKEAFLKTLPPSPENDRIRGELMAIVCRTMVLTGRVSSGIRLAQEALSYLPAEERASRARAGSALAIGYGLQGFAEDADMAYREALEQALSAGDYRLAAHTAMVMGLLQYQYGRLHTAAHHFQSIIDMEEQVNLSAAPPKSPQQVFFSAGRGYIGLASVHLERNNLQTAEDFLKRGMDLCRRGGLDGVFLGQVFLSRLRQAQDDLDGALAIVQQATQMVQRVDDFNIAARRIEIGLAKGDIDGSAQLIAPFVEMFNASPSPPLPLVFAEIVEVLITRVFIAQGETARAIEWLDRIQNTAEQGERHARLIEVYLLRALLRQQQDEGRINTEALDDFSLALQLAEPEGYILTFLLEGPRLRPLLQAIISRQTTPSAIKAYAHKLLLAFAEPVLPPSSGEAVELVEQLTPRELEVLQLVATGDSNQAIADKLFITVRTVKKHITGILGKLGVNNRTQAVARAREIGLLTWD